MSNHFSATIPLTETPVTIEQGEARTALAYLIRHDATDLAEALGIVGYQGNDYRAHQRTPAVPVWREGSLT